MPASTPTRRLLLIMVMNADAPLHVCMLAAQLGQVAAASQLQHCLRRRAGQLTCRAGACNKLLTHVITAAVANATLHDQHCKHDLHCRSSACYLRTRQSLPPHSLPSTRCPAPHPAAAAPQPQPLSVGWHPSGSAPEPPCPSGPPQASLHRPAPAPARCRKSRPPRPNPQSASRAPACSRQTRQPQTCQ